MTKKRVPPFSPEVRARAVRMVLDHQEEHGSQWAAMQSIAAKIGCSGETLRNWVRQAERNEGVRPGPTSAEKEELATLEWVDWFNNRRLFEPIGNIPPAEAEETYYAQLEVMPIAA